MNGKVPDLTAYRLDEAIGVLKEMKLNYSLQKTAPPGRKDNNRQTFYRVLKQTEIGNDIIAFIIAAE